MALKIYSSVEMELKLKVRKFWGLILRLDKLEGILGRVKANYTEPKMLSHNLQK